MNDVRSAIGASLDHPFAEEAFDLVDLIEANIADLDFDGDPDHHETAAEIADTLVSVMSTRSIANLWAILGADGEGAEIGYPPDDAGMTSDRVGLDLFVVVERAVHAGLVAATGSDPEEA